MEALILHTLFALDEDAGMRDVRTRHRGNLVDGVRMAFRELVVGAEIEGTGAAGRHAGRDAVRLTCVDAGIALLGDAEFLHEHGRIVGAGDDAGTASDAYVVVVLDGSIGFVAIHRLRRALGYACRVLAMLAAKREMVERHGGEGTRLVARHVPVPDAFGQVVFLVASDHAGLAAHAAVAIEEECLSFHGLLLPFLAGNADCCQVVAVCNR